MSAGGKGSSPRPFSIDRKTFENNWDKIFKNEYQDELSTEDCVISALNDSRWDHYSDLPSPEAYEERKNDNT